MDHDGDSGPGGAWGAWGLMSGQVIDLQQGSPAAGGRHEGLVRQRLRGLKVAWLVGDIVLLALAFLLVSRLQYGNDWRTTWSRLLPDWRLWVPVYAGGVAFFWRQLGMYRINPGWSVRQEMRRSFTAGLYLLTLTTGILFAANLDEVSRLLVFTVVEFLVVGSAATRVAGRTWLTRRRSTGRGNVNVLVVGTGELAQLFIAELHAVKEAGMRAVGYLGAWQDDMAGLPRLGDIDELANVLASNVVDEVVVCLGFDHWQTIASVIRSAEDQGKSVHLPVWGLGNVKSEGRFETLGGMPVLSLSARSDRELYRTAKRGMDLAGALVGLLIFSPVLLATAVAIRLQDRGPSLYRQTRIGMHGRAFQIVKFRTMVMNADQLMSEHMAELHRRGEAFKDEEDPRITRLGRFLRKTSIDEFPQFWNVLKGDMSLVGPRPMVQSEVDHFTHTHRRRLSVKPGITGLWQVEARNETDFESRFAQDLRYIDEFSLGLDLRILGRTAGAVLRMTGK